MRRYRTKRPLRRLSREDRPAGRPGAVPGGHRRGAPTLTAELADINRRLRESGFKTVWGKMTEDAKDLYRAWITLRRNYGQNAGEYMLGVDLGSGRRPVDRQRYQAGAFSEFCAEGFMHEAMGDLDNHFQMIMDGDDVPDKVKTAWRMAYDVFKRQARPILDGPGVVVG